jgi:hypothetical protein
MAVPRAIRRWAAAERVVPGDEVAAVMVSSVELVRRCHVEWWGLESTCPEKFPELRLRDTV